MLTAARTSRYLGTQSSPIDEVVASVRGFSVHQMLQDCFGVLFAKPPLQACRLLYSHNFTNALKDELSIGHLRVAIGGKVLGLHQGQHTLGEKLHDFSFRMRANLIPNSDYFPQFAKFIIKLCDQCSQHSLDHDSTLLMLEDCKTLLEGRVSPIVSERSKQMIEFIKGRIAVKQGRIDDAYEHFCASLTGRYEAFSFSNTLDNSRCMSEIYNFIDRLPSGDPRKIKLKLKWYNQDSYLATASRT